MRFQTKISPQKLGRKFERENLGEIANKILTNPFEYDTVNYGLGKTH